MILQARAVSAAHEAVCAHERREKRRAPAEMYRALDAAVAAWRAIPGVGDMSALAYVEQQDQCTAMLLHGEVS